jgi:hypothetical protein
MTGREENPLPSALFLTIRAARLRFPSFGFTMNLLGRIHD